MLSIISELGTTDRLHQDQNTQKTQDSSSHSILAITDRQVFDFFHRFLHEYINCQFAGWNRRIAENSQKKKKKKLTIFLDLFCVLIFFTTLAANFQIFD